MYKPPRLSRSKTKDTVTGRMWIRQRLKDTQKDLTMTAFVGSGLKPNPNGTRTKARISSPRLRRRYIELPGEGILQRY